MMNQIIIKQNNDGIEITHFISNDDLRKKIDFKKEQLKRDYQGYIEVFEILWDKESGYGKIKVYYDFIGVKNILSNFLSQLIDKEYQFSIYLDNNKMLIVFPYDSIIPAIYKLFKKKIDEHILSIFDIQIIKILRKKRIGRRHIPPRKIQ